MKQRPWLMLFLLSICALNFTAAAQDCDFDCALKTHLDAIQQKDFDSFLTTITREDSISFILPNGAYFDSRAQFVEMLRGWFAEGGWHFNYKIIRKVKGADLSMALLLVSYDEDDRNGQPYHIDHYLNLIFQKENGEWRLTHDQNTKTELE